MDNNIEQAYVTSVPEIVIAIKNISYLLIFCNKFNFSCTRVN